MATVEGSPEGDDGDGNGRPFDPVDWDRVDSRTASPRLRTVVFVAGTLVWAAAFLYSEVVLLPGEPVAFGLEMSPIDWPFGLALLAVGCYVVVPAARNRRRVRRYWAEFRANRLAVLATAYLAVFAFVGLFGPPIVDLLEATAGITSAREGSIARLQPPVGTTVPVETVERCVGPVVDGRCHGTVQHPLGTNDFNRDVFEGLVEGTRVALAISVTTAVFIVPIAGGVGIAVAYVGGWVDEAVMRYLDVQQVIPPFFIYIIVQFPLQRSLWLMVLVFGLLNWGSTARLVRSETLATVELDYVTASRSAGSSPLWVIRKHLVPNVSNTVVTAMTFFIPRMILIEASLAWLSLSSGHVYSWGNQLGGAPRMSETIALDGIPLDVWWTEWFTIAALFLTIVAFYVVGDALRDVLDPRLQT